MTGDGGPLLIGQGLYKSFGSIPALRGVDISVGAGEVLAVMGPSGSGKSTLLHCPAGVLTPDAGEVTFDGRHVDRMPDKRRSRLRRTEFGFVFQFGQLVPELTIRENIALPLLLGGAGRRAASAAARSWMSRLGLAESADRLPGEVSGGQGQRAAVARALIAGPRVVFADEPTGALDGSSARGVLTVLREAVDVHRQTVVMVTHDPVAAAYADSVVFLADGRIVGTMDNPTAADVAEQMLRLDPAATGRS